VWSSVSDSKLKLLHLERLHASIEHMSEKNAVGPVETVDSGVPLRAFLGVL
jgi:hypothetical protein